MKTDWDYTHLADAYRSRPEYAAAAIDELLARADVRPGDSAIDIGAGTGHLTVALAARGLQVTAVEPNDAMRRHGEARTAAMPNVRFTEATAEETTLPSASAALVTFGSSFNVTRQQDALREAHRLLRPRGWFACMWNHRALGDPLQSAVEDVIRANVPEYSYGARREDQQSIVDASGFFGPVTRIDAAVLHRMPVSAWLDAWRSHATLARQAGERFDAVLRAIDAVVRERVADAEVIVPYVTRVWVAQARDL